ncbi:hypothetical protein L211DRAFT_109006 [Terfezia boudieri ATCC MYA-4762]|uniref:PPP4R2-domain-containing protein n=1 Tax=Terfezia boudieri ATCC MYA-4762 TaxID=1051890 RepID=A0A3N4LQS8_9PEZI|nr:hypothetical protein L211DRAFT_109006 [Terfezia boudieri ATCC MYA-4762]
MKPDDMLIESIILDGKVELESWPSLLNSFLERIDEAITSTNHGPGAQSIDTADQPSQPAYVPDTSDRTLPPNIDIVVASIKETLTTTFSTAPPHTVQRLAELFQKPNEHYRSLPKFLRAVQRVISVSSTTDQFPLPSAVEHPTTVMLNALGSDESLGGALLTPISWLRNDVVSCDSESDTKMNGVVQGELLRQEQELDKQGSSSTPDAEHDDMQQMHAQGPPKLGPEDLGPQPPGVVFPDLDDAPPETALEPEIQAKQEEMMDTPMTGDEGATDAPQNASETEDKMDVDDAVTEGKEFSAEALDKAMSDDDDDAGRNVDKT